MSVTDHVESKQSQIDGAGCGLFARQDFSPGDLVLSLSRPLLAELEIYHMLDTCGWCLQRAAVDPTERTQSAAMGLPSAFIEIKSCTGCRRVGYCSKTCQSRAWKREHKYECKVLAPQERPHLPLPIRATIKLLGRLKAASTDSEKQQILDILNFRPAGGGGDLLDVHRQDKQKYVDFHMLANAAWNYAGKPVLDGSDSQAVAKGLLINVMNNSFGLSSALDDIHLGSGFDPLICSANHSCEPNVVIISNQPSIALRALRPIKKGEEIFLRYTDVTNPFEMRRADLKQRYFFDCKCSKCLRGPDTPEEAFAKRPEDLPAEYRSLADSLIEHDKRPLPGPDSSDVHLARLAALKSSVFAVSENERATEAEVKKALKWCIDSGMWRWTQAPVPQLCRQLFRLYLEGGQIYRCFRLGCKIFFEINPAQHPHAFYPDRLIFTWVMSTLANVLSGPKHEELYTELARNGIELRVLYFGFLFRVYDNIPKSYGWDSPFGRVVDATWKQVMAGVGLSRPEMEEKIEKYWPNLEIYARSVDVIKLCDSSDNEDDGMI
ncbi:hypothetical protein F4779DRAFT_621309 [Xylariaceae sp. FL0662B]|nr:hypothetical protein F4779DRAFT_621309 [Xylariaceae sp. FL0662B]